MFWKKSEGSDDTHDPYWDLAIAGFRFSDLGAEDESRAIFEYCFKGEQDTYSPFFGYTSGDKQHFLLHDLSFRLSSNKDKKNPQLSCWEEDEATTEVRYSGSELPDEKQRIFVVQVRNGLIDAEFSKFQLDTTNDSVCVDWRNLVTNYFDQHSAGVRQKEKVSVRKITAKSIVLV